MEKYSAEWKKQNSPWVQEHENGKWGKHWKVHYIRSDTEYSVGEYLSKEDAEEDLDQYRQ